MRAVDLFAGAGGFTEGATRAGLDVRWAANHWQLAVDVHRARHPNALHSCQDLQQADFTQLPSHDVLLASPACTGHSEAGQGARGKWGLDWSHHDPSRATAWAVVAAAEAARPEWLVVENVPQFAQWQLFEAWQNALTTLGYRMERATLNAADFGVAQERRRLIIVGRYQRAPRVLDHLPETTPWVPMRSILDPAASDWKPVAGKSDRVRERVSRSRKRHGDHFMTQHVRDHMGRSLDQPMPTITTADQYAIVRGDMMRTLTIGEQLRAQGFEADYFEGVRMTRKEACRLIGNAIPPQLAEGVISTIAAA